MADTGKGYLGIINEDQGSLDTWTFITTGVVSGGNFVIAGSHANAATLSKSGGAIVWNANMLTCSEGGSGANRPVGLAFQNAGSNEYVAIVRRGMYILPTGGDVVPGSLMAATGVTGVVNEAAAYDAVIGQALTANASGANNYAIVRLNI